MPNSRGWHFLALGPLILVAVAMRPGDELDRFIQAQMARRQITGLSLAIVHGGRIVDARAYGTTTRDGKTPVTPETLFQAGSVSKPVSAVGALRLVDAGTLSLDEDVNSKLTSWHVPDNEFTATEHVTLRRLLTHTAGLNVGGFPGYEPTERIPSVTDVLAGRGNTPLVRVEAVPGTTSRYSGGGYTVMQQLVEDVSAKPFARYMREEVLKQFGMTSSTFEHPLPAPLARRAASGHLVDRSQLPGGWHAYPEMAAAGLWTTPTDLAKYVIGVQQALAGKSRVLSAGMTRQMLTVHKAGMGLGPAVDGNGLNLQFSHNGRSRGFDTLLIAYAQAGDGLVVMANGNDNTLFMQGNCCQNRIVNFVARKYRWPEYKFPPAPEIVRPVGVPPEVLSALAGRYEFQNPTTIALGAQSGRISTYVDGLPDEEFVPAADGRFVSTERAVSFRVLRTATGDVQGLDWVEPTGNSRRMPRIGPLFASISQSVADPDPSFTRTALTVVQMLAAGDKRAAESPLLTAGARKEFGSVAIASLRDVRGLAFLYQSNVAGRGLVRLGHPIEKVVHYRMETERGQRWLLVHVDGAGLVADFDVVDN